MIILQKKVLHENNPTDDCHPWKSKESNMNTRRDSLTIHPTIRTLPKVRQAAIVCPFCILGIALIFWAKPSSGSTVTGLALWTVIMQGFSAIFLVLVFRAAKSVSDTIEEQKIIEKIALPEKELLEKVYRTGRYAPIDTKPHPEHIPEWMEHNKGILQSIIATFEKCHAIPTGCREKIRESFHRGLSELITSQPDGGNSFAVPRQEVKKMIDQLMMDL